MSPADEFAVLLRSIRNCRVCETSLPPLPHPAQPICMASAHSKIRIISQAPGNLADKKGLPFYDPSGVRLRDWLGVNEAQFYNVDNFAITPVGFCFPGYDKNGGDLPPRPECAPLWQSRLDTELRDIPLTLLVGGYAQKWVLGKAAKRTLTETVRNWRDYGPDILPLPHPSWRNNGWIKKHNWFEDVLSHLKDRVADLVK
ncbi:uracil-DNA glycosylase family protein [Robiginitomaculum antarcticum]|uniref:uracil-DNA glycosylase family protein n=1 Tax=Robiginitomaculum antarcticum TaxID=437507 RepID=UPI000372B514|nr:uracil-DNA glycosylase family protein [Robiginitomaculum antarcticum]